MADIRIRVSASHKTATFSKMPRRLDQADLTALIVVASMAVEEMRKPVTKKKAVSQS